MTGFALTLFHGDIFGDPGSGQERMRAIVAAGILGVVEDRKLIERAAAGRIGIAAADFSRIRRANIGHFTIERLMKILAGLGRNVEVSAKARPHVDRAGSVAVRTRRNGAPGCIGQSRVRIWSWPAPLRRLRDGGRPSWPGRRCSWC